MLHLCSACFCEAEKYFRLFADNSEHISLQECQICGNLSLKTETLASQALTLAMSKGYEWRTFRVNVTSSLTKKKRSELITALELAAKVKIRLKTGAAIERLSRANVDVTDPDLQFTIVTPSGKIFLQSKPVYVEGVYTKHTRHIPQSKWGCRQCMGSGCLECDFRGRHYGSSVEELLSVPATTFLGAEKVYLHAGGREDVDVLSLNGRPMILEAVDPKRRVFSSIRLASYINMYSQPFVRVKLDKQVDRHRIATIKQDSEGRYKSYRGKMFFPKGIEQERLEKKLNHLGEFYIKQATPHRVMNTRSDLIRTKKILKVNATYVDTHHAFFDLVCQGGTYVKEFISGDDGRTQPSLFEMLETPARCIELDLVGVFADSDHF